MFMRYDFPFACLQELGKQIASHRAFRHRKTNQTQEPVKSSIATFAAALLTLTSPASGHGFDVLVFTKTAGFAHGSIPAGVAAVQALMNTKTRCR